MIWLVAGLVSAQRLFHFELAPETPALLQSSQYLPRPLREPLGSGVSLAQAFPEKPRGRASLSALLLAALLAGKGFRLALSGEQRKGLVNGPRLTSDGQSIVPLMASQDDWNTVRPDSSNEFHSLPETASQMSRRQAVIAAMAGLSAEAAWRQAVATAATALDASSSAILPPGTIQQIESGRAVVIRDWLPPEETAALLADSTACWEAGAFNVNFILSRNASKKDKAANDRWCMRSFLKGKDGPFSDASVGTFAVRQRLKARMAEVNKDTSE